MLVPPIPNLAPYSRTLAWSQEPACHWNDPAGPVFWGGKEYPLAFFSSSCQLTPFRLKIGEISGSLHNVGWILTPPEPRHISKFRGAMVCLFIMVWLNRLPEILLHRGVNRAVLSYYIGGSWGFFCPGAIVLWDSRPNAFCTGLRWYFIFFYGRVDSWYAWGFYVALHTICGNWSNLQEHLLVSSACPQHIEKDSQRSMRIEIGIGCSSLAHFRKAL